MEPIRKNVTATVATQIQKAVSNVLYYEIWTTEEYYWYTSLAAEGLFVLLFLLFACLSFRYYYGVEQHPLVKHVENRIAVPTIQKKKE